MKFIKKAFYVKRIKVDAEGLDNLVKSPMLIIANHKSNADSLAMFKVLYAHRNSKHNKFEFVFIAKQELSQKRFLSKILNLADVLYLDRKNPRQQVGVYNEEIRQVKEQKKSIVVFIEGTRHFGDQFGEFHPGALRLAYDTMIPIVPMAIYGSSGLMDSNKSNIDKHRKIMFKIFKPLNPYEFKHNHTQWLAERLREDMQSAYDEMAKKARAKKKPSGTK